MALDDVKEFLRSQPKALFSVENPSDGGVITPVDTKQDFDQKIVELEKELRQVAARPGHSRNELKLIQKQKLELIKQKQLAPEGN